MGRSDRPSSKDERPGDERRGDEASVDFIVGAQDEHSDPDEELPQPDAGRTRSKRLRTELGVGALGLIVALLIARSAFGPHSTPQAAPTSPASVAHEPAPTGPVTAPPFLYKGNLPPDRSTSSATAATAVPHPAFPKTIPRRHGSNPVACPGLRCTSSTALPTSVTDAIQSAFPESTLLRTETVRLRGGDRVLWFREVDVRAGSEVVALRVQAPAEGDRTRSGQSTDSGQRTTFVDTSLGPWHVDVRVVDLIGGRPPADVLDRLAHDPRIVAL